MNPAENTRFAAEFAVGNRRIGGDAPVFVIAEAGVAHFGDFDMARQLLRLSVEAGADAFKLQVFDVDQLFAERSSEWRDRLRPRTLERPQVEQLRDECRAAGLAFILTAHDESKISWLVELDVDAVKIGSGERNNTGFIRRLGALGKPVLLSTGMYSPADVEEALDALAEGGCGEVGLLHCVSSYPTPEEQVNLRAMEHLAELFPGPVGYSDHTPDDLALLGAVAAGARILERHITVLRDVPNAQDWKVSSGPEDFPQTVARIRRIEAMLGHGRKTPADCEQGAMTWALKSLVARRPLEAGHRLTENDLAAKRPGDGIAPNRLEEVLGRCLRRSVALDEPIRWDDLADG